MSAVPIRVAKTAGFCFGVARAVKTVEDLLRSGEAVATLGPLIHNPGFIEDLKRRGVTVVETPGDTPPGCRLVVRTHGVPKEVSEEIASLGISSVDVTCPFVKKIHGIVAERSAAGDTVLIAGDPDHPEVAGIRSYASGPVFVVESAEALTALCEGGEVAPDTPVTLVSQTTFSEKEFKKCEKNAKILYTNLKIFDTICNATALRQAEALAMSGENDMMLVIGGRNSSNTQKLFGISAAHTRTYLIENAAELSAISCQGVHSIGVTAGASTPEGNIKEVVKTMSEIIDNIGTVAEAEGQAEVIADPEEMSFEQALEENLSSMNNDQKVVGTVLRITPTEIQVDIGRKYAGFVPVEEYSNDPTADPQKELKIGDEIKLIIMKTNDSEGTMMLSKRRYDAKAAWDQITEAKDNEEILEGVIAEAVKGGVLVYTKGVRVFIPGSLTGLPRDAELSELVKQTVKFRIIDVDKQKKRAVGSIRSVLREERKAATEAFWNEIEEGKEYTGTVKSLTSYGAFVDLGGVDGMIHISELSWKRIKHPSEVVKEGDTVNVYVKALDKENKRISLGYKRVEDNPWEILKRDYPVGTVCEATVVGLTSFGAFANVIDGIDGLIHISQIADRRIASPAEVLHVGDVVTVKITDIDFEKKRVSLSIRALLEPTNGIDLSDEADAEDEQDIADAEEAVAEAIVDEAEAAPAEPAEEAAAAIADADLVEEAEEAVAEAIVEEAEAAPAEAAEEAAEALESTDAE